MFRLKTQVVWGVLMIATWTETIAGYRLNTTIHDTNSAHVTYSEAPIGCNRWVNSWLFWQVCDSWLKPWTSGVYHSQGKLVTFHSSLNHQFSSVTIEFQGTDVWVYGPPLRELAEIPPDYKICLYESYHHSSKQQCYHVNTTEAYYGSQDEDEPVVVFARGQLPNSQHQIVISVADPVNNLQAYSGIKFSHVVYTSERPTPWPVEEDRWRYREVVMHDTHPLLSYYPPVTSNPLAETPAWIAKVHTAEDGTVTTWHELKSHNEGDQDQWRVEAKIRAGAVAIYGAPRAYVETNRFSLGLVCVRLDLGLCETVDLKATYANEGYHTESEPVLLWRSDALDPSRETHVSIHLVKAPTGTATVFPLKSINYFEGKEYASPGSLVGNLENMTIDNESQDISYSPERRCIERGLNGVCTVWYSPWTKKQVGPSGSVLTYRSTLSQHRAKEDPHITLTFRGSAVYLHGAPNAYATRPFAAQHVCINNECRVIDVDQAYLHPPRDDMEPASISEAQDQNAIIQNAVAPLSIPHPELEPVLIWSITGLDDKVLHTLRLALASLPSPDNAEMSFVKAVYTRVAYRWGEDRPDPPAPKLDHAYGGPLQPPYATKWVPSDHKPPPPTVVDHRPPSRGPVTSVLLVISLLVAYVSFGLALGFWKRQTDETQPLLPGHLPPGPHYSRSEARPESTPRSNRPTRSTDPNNARRQPSATSPPPRHSNATDTPPSYSPFTPSGSNRRG